MQSRDFCYWLQGFFELSDTKTLNAKQLTTIKNHLNMVFVHEIDPSMGDAEKQKELNKVHNKLSMGEEETIKKFGKKPAPHYELSYLHGWYDPAEGVPRC